MLSIRRMPARETAHRRHKSAQDCFGNQQRIWNSAALAAVECWIGAPAGLGWLRNLGAAGEALSLWTGPGLLFISALRYSRFYSSQHQAKDGRYATQFRAERVYPGEDTGLGNRRPTPHWVVTGMRNLYKDCCHYQIQAELPADSSAGSGPGLR